MRDAWSEFDLKHSNYKVQIHTVMTSAPASISELSPFAALSSDALSNFLFAFLASFFAAFVANASLMTLDGPNTAFEMV